jgi:hypothetical protein
MQTAEEGTAETPGPRPRRRGALAALAGALLAGLAVFLTAPAPILVDIAAFDTDADEFAGSITPEVTEFYDVEGWTAAPAGTLARAEPIEPAPPGVRAWRILYHSTDLAGDDLPVSGLYVAPDREPPPGGWPLVSFAHGTLGVGRMCGVSQDPFTPGTPSNTAWGPHLQPMIEHGWAVVASDYSGMGAPGPASYLVGPLEARNVLDAARAVLLPDPRIGSVLVDAGRIGVYGKSQGGEAAISALELAPAYAPELDVKGGVSLAPGFLAPVPGAIDLVAGNPTSTSQNYFTLLLVRSYAENYPDLLSVDDVLSDEGMRRLPLTDRHCSSDLSDRVSDVPLSELVDVPVHRGFVDALNRGQPGQVPLTMPLIVVQGLEDVTILPELTHAQVMARCALADTVEYVTYPDDDHPSVNFQARVSEPNVLDWLDARFDGEPARHTCPNSDLGMGIAGGAR